MDAVSCALRRLDKTKPVSLPRMADFAVWAIAAEPALGLQSGEFMRAYGGNRDSANELALEFAAVSAELIKLIREERCWTGTAGKLLEELNSRTPESMQRQPSWPKSAQGMGGRLIRIAPNLRAVGINAVRGTGGKRRAWTLEMSGS